MAETLKILAKINPHTSIIENKKSTGSINGVSLNEIITSKKEHTNSGNKPAALFLLDKDGVIILLEGSGLEELNLNKYELLGGYIHEQFSNIPPIIEVVCKAVKIGEETAVFKSREKTYEIHITYTYRNKNEHTGTLIVVIEASSSNTKCNEETDNTLLRQLFEKSPDAIVILDNEDNIVEANSSFEKLFGFEKPAIAGFNIYKLIHPEHLLSEIADINRAIDNNLVIQIDTERKKCCGEYIDVSLLVYNIESNGKKTGSYHVYRDISKRKENEESIKNSLLEKEMLLKEVHHRVKNNLQIVSSLLFLQTKTIKEQEIIDKFLESQNRVKSIALIHEKLYQSKNLSRIDFERYLQTFIPHLFQTFGKTNGNICYKIKAGNIFLNTDTAIPCGLIVNETVTNSLKYAFSDTAKGEIIIELIYHNNNQLTLLVSDNGIGLPDEIDTNASETLGLQIITLLVKQLNGQLEIYRKNGTKYKINFPFAEYKSRNFTNACI